MGWLKDITRRLGRAEAPQNGTAELPSVEPTDVNPTTTDEHSRKGNYSSDSPIQKPEDDKFHRLPFAQRVADALVHRTAPDSIVVGIYGAWGQGKTSVLNLIDHRLHGHADIKVLRFNPWRYQNEDQLLIAFFEAVADLLGEKLYTLIERGLRSRVGQTISKGSSSVPYAEGASGVIDVLSSVEVEQLKERIEGILIKAKKRVIVLVDDIDRLDKHEIFSVFRLVKLTANLKHVSFILAFDDEVVSDALQEHYAYTRAESGRAFLEKIIQVPLELPHIQPTVLREQCFDGINSTLGDSGLTISAEEGQRFAHSFNSGLLPVLQTPRAVMRYVNALTFTLPILKGDLNIVDMMILEGIRIFFPSVYEAIRAGKDTFLVRQVSSNLAEHDRQLVQKEYDAVLQLLPPDQRKPCTSLVSALFPRLAGIISNWYPQDNGKQLELDKRICAARYYDRYFMLNIGRGDISDVRIERIVSLANDAGVNSSDLQSEITTAISDAQADVVIYKLGLHDDELALDAGRKMCLALSQLGNALPEAPFTILGGARRDAAWLIVALLNKIQDKGARIALALELMQRSEPLEFAVDILYSIPTEKEDPVAGALTREEKLEIGKALAGRFESLASSGELFSKPDDSVSSLISAWSKLGDKAALSQQLKKQIQSSPQYAARLVTILRSNVTTVGIAGTSKGDLEFPTYSYIIGLVPEEFMVQSISQTYDVDAFSSNEWPRSRRGDNDDLRSAQQFMWRHKHNTKPTSEEPQEAQ